MRTFIALIVAVAVLGVGNVTWGNMAAPPPTPKPIHPPLAANEYEIKEGDTFTSIAIAKFHDHRFADKIAALNPGVDPNKLKIGQRIKLPPKPATSQAVSRPASQPKVLHKVPGKGVGWNRAGGVVLGLGVAALVMAGGFCFLRRRND